MHKKTCSKKLCIEGLDEMFKKVMEADADSSRWREVLAWEGRMEESLMCLPDDARRVALIKAFSEAHEAGAIQTGKTEHWKKAITLDKRRCELLGTLQRFRDQGSPPDFRSLYPVFEHSNTIAPA